MSHQECSPSPIGISSRLKLKENIVVKHQRAMKVCSFDLMSFIDENIGFVDPDFPHSFSSINGNIYEGTVEWKPAQTITKDMSYSSTMLSIQQGMFAKKSVAQALTLLNWFANPSFGEIFLRELSRQRLYVFDVMVDGVFMQLPVDSYIPVDEQTKAEIFSNNYKGSIFPCLYEKLLAKIYGNYYQITQEFIDIVELQTSFCRQQLPLTQGIGLPQLQSVIAKKLQENSMVCFRTRNSIRLESFGLQSNHIYVVVRLLSKEGECLVQFLELEGESWIGKMSKLRSDWLICQRSFMERNSIVVDNEKVKENYMRLSDLKGIGRQLVILNNTYQYHKNYEICQHNPHYLTMYRFKLQQTNRVMIRVNYKHKKCYNSIILIQEQNNTHKLLLSSFHQHKESNYLEAILQPDQYCLIVYNTHPQEQNLTYHLTVFSSEAFIDLNPIASKTDILPVMESAFKNYFRQISDHQQRQIIFKQLYSWTGMAFAYLRPTNGNLKLTLRLSALEQSKTLALNLKESLGKQQWTKEVQNGQEDIVIFRCLWSKKQNIVFEYDQKAAAERICFPPPGSVKVTQTKLR